MYITHIIEATATGTLSMAALLANSQIKDGHDVEVIYSRRTETPDNLDDHFDAGIKLTKIQMISISEKFFSIFLIRKVLLKSNSDVVFMHSSFAGFFGRLAGLGILPNTRFLYIPHCISFMRTDLSWLKKIIFLGFEWIGALKKSTYVACSNSEKKIISKYVPIRKCYLVENAVEDLVGYESQAYDNKTVVTVGQIRSQKGPLDFAKIAKRVRVNKPDIIFRWVGDGDEKAKQVLIDAGVEITGWVSRSQVIDYLATSAVYLSTAHWEGMPVSVIEANYANLPVVASACPGNVDVVAHGETGWLFNAETEADELIIKALDNRSATKKIIENAAREAKHRFSLDRYVNEMNSLIVKNIEEKL